jgi:carboxyl-terminal processing protease
MSSLIHPSVSQRVSRLFIAAAIIAGISGPSWAAELKPGPNDRHITAAVIALLKEQHLLRHPLDNEISQRCYKTFIKSLDPLKVYFYQSDIDEFDKQKDKLCEALRNRDVSFAYTVFLTFMERVDQRVAMVDELLAEPLDFTADEQMATDRDQLNYPKTPEEAKQRWRERIKYDLLMLKSADKDERKEGQEARDKLKRRYHSFAKRMHQIDGTELLEMYLNAFTMAFDPHTSYMSPRTQKNFEIAMSLELEGVGASLMNDDGYTLVKKIIPGGALDKMNRELAKSGQTGIQLEDKIIGVGQGEEGEIVDVVDMKLNDVVDLIRGKHGTFVRLEVLPANGQGRKVYKLARERIELKDSEAKGEVFEVGKKPDGSPYRVGVIDLPSFYRDMTGDRMGRTNFKSTTRDVRAILDRFKSSGIDAVVLDLRSNGGGALNEAISLTGLFIKDGPVVQVKDAEGRVHPYYDSDSQIAWEGPLVVLISKFSASASEILAGAIQDYNRGLIVGDHATHGKGTVQSLLDLRQPLFGGLPNVEPMGALKITMQQFYRPYGDSTQKRGVVSDIELPSLTTHLDVGEADLDYPIPFDKINPAPNIKRFNDVTPAIREQLAALSRQRVDQSEEFQKIIRNIARYKEQKAKKFVTLNEEKFLKERAEINADREAEKALEKHSDLGNGEHIERDCFINEAMAIAIDLLNVQQLAKANTGK